MALGNYGDSVLLAAVGLMDKKFNSKELRKPKYGAVDAFLNKRELLIPSHREIWKSESQVLTAKYLERDAGTVADSRTCTPTADLKDSGTLDLSWQTYAFTVKTNVKVFENNYYSQLQAFQNDLYNGFMDAYNEIETDAVAFLDANRTTLQGLRTLNTWDAVNDIMVVANDDRDNYLNYISTELYAQRYRGVLQDIHSINLRAMYRQQFAQGASNDENLQFQFPGFLHYDSYMIDSSGYFGTSYIVEEGGIALLDWIPPINRNGQVAASGPVWTTMADPFGYPFTWAVYTKDGCEDTDHGNTGDPYGAVQDYYKIYEISLDLSFNAAPITVAGETPIHKYALATA
jgi:hypothetical protein